MADLSGVLLELEGRTLKEEEREFWLQKAREKRLWNYQQTQVYEAQQLAGSLGKGVKVGIIDSGIDYAHEQFQHLERIPGVNVSGSGSLNDPLDTFGHGTQVAGIICGKEIGIAPDVELYAVKIRESDLRKDTSLGFARTVALGLNFCEDVSCDVVNISLGITQYSPSLKLACEQLYKKGILLIASSGNRYTGANFPASFSEYVISVGAINREQRYESGNVWSFKDVVAPGKDIFTVGRDNQYQSCEGTSYSAAHVTGIMALAVAVLKRSNAKLEQSKIREALQTTADKSVLNFQQAEEFIEQYDPSRRILNDPSIAAQLMFGSGLVQAKALIENIQKEYRI